MACTHPVLYSRDCVLYCQVCGAVIQPPEPKQEPESKPKKTRKSAK